MGLAGDHKPWHQSIFRLTLPTAGNHCFRLRRQEDSETCSFPPHPGKPAHKGKPRPGPEEPCLPGQGLWGFCSVTARTCHILSTSSWLSSKIHQGKRSAAVEPGLGGWLRPNVGGGPFLELLAQPPSLLWCSATRDPGSRWAPELPQAEAGQLVPDGTPLWE